MAHPPARAYYVGKMRYGMHICIPRLIPHTPLAERRGMMRQRTLSLLLAFVLVPLLTLACAGGDTESADSEDAAGEAETMEATPLEEAATEEGDMDEGEEGEGEEEEGHEDPDADDPDTTATGN